MTAWPLRRRPQPEPAGPLVPAIVLSCDRYRGLPEHMIKCYDSVWPSHPFEFHVPYQQTPTLLDRVVPHQTSEPIRATVLALLEELDDESWVYWCIDDKYPIRLCVPEIQTITTAIRHDALGDVDGVLFCRCRRLAAPDYPFGERVGGPGGIALLRRSDYAQIWIHQFLRAKVLRRLFLALPESVPQAKALDALAEQLTLPLDQSLYVTVTNFAVFGESTTRGMITRNCARSMRAFRLPPPATLAETNEVIVMGALSRPRLRRR